MPDAWTHDVACLLDRTHDLLMIGGGAVIVATFLAWRRSGGDPLRGAPIRACRLEPVRLWLCLCAYLLILLTAAGLAAAVMPVADGDTGRQAAASMLASNLTQILAIGVFILIARRWFTAGLRGLGLERLPWSRVAVLGSAGWLAATGSCGVVLLVTEQVIRWLEFSPPRHAVLTTLADPAAPVWVRLAAVGGAAVLAPVGEEIFYRGILQTGLRKLCPRIGRTLLHRWIAVAAASAAFAMMHRSTPHHVPALFVLSLLLGGLYERTGSLGVPILVHMLFNIRTLVWYAMLEPWSAWQAVVRVFQ